MPIKYIGIIMILIAFTMFGFYKSFKLSKRKSCISDILLFLNKLSTAVRYRTADVFALVEECSDGCLSSLDTKKNLSEAAQKLDLHKDDKKLLQSFFSEFGKDDVEGELSRIEYYKHIFNEQYQTAKAEIENKSKLYKISGLFTGLAFAVILF